MLHDARRIAMHDCCTRRSFGTIDCEHDPRGAEMDAVRACNHRRNRSPHTVQLEVRQREQIIQSRSQQEPVGHDRKDKPARECEGG